MLKRPEGIFLSEYERGDIGVGKARMSQCCKSPTRRPSGPGARRLPPQMFREYPNDVTLNGGGFVKQVGRNSRNGFGLGRRCLL
jgi:hypothetical protein